jgi:hypothetical protein
MPKEAKMGTVDNLEVSMVHATGQILLSIRGEVKTDHRAIRMSPDEAISIAKQLIDEAMRSVKAVGGKSD